MSSARPPEAKRASQVYTLDAKPNPNKLFFSLSTHSPQQS